MTGGSRLYSSLAGERGVDPRRENESFRMDRR